MEWGNRYFEKIRRDCVDASFLWSQGESDLLKGNRYFRKDWDRHQYRPGSNPYKTFVAMLDDPNCKRLMFDGRQARLFADMANLKDGPPDEFNHILEWPFDLFYLEFSEPVEYLPNEPGHTDVLRSMLIWKNSKGLDIIPGGNPDKAMREATLEMLKNLSQVIFFHQSENGDLVDRSFHVNLKMGLGATTVGTMTDPDDPDPSELHPEEKHIIPESYVVAQDEDHLNSGRHVGWWESYVANSARFLQWIVSFMTAKSIVIYEEQMTRAQRRFEERRGIPKPWHIVDVKPKYYPFGRPSHQEGLGTPHSFRYDVIGHLRFGRHKKKDGTYSYTHEWVPSHQRGLANSLYIPKTYRVKGKAGKSLIETHKMLIGG